MTYLINGVRMKLLITTIKPKPKVITNIYLYSDEIFILNYEVYVHINGDLLAITDL